MPADFLNKFIHLFGPPGFWLLPVTGLGFFDGTFQV